MISKFPGRCAKCNGPIKAGDEIHYDGELKKAFHPGCRVDGKLFSGDDADAIARRLGFIGPDEAIPTEWRVRKVPAATGSETAGRP